MSKTTDIVTELARPIVEKNGCELWDVEYVREAGEWFLRVYIDKDGGVSINDCEAISRELDPVLDENDPIAESYTFEVSSAGAERALKRPSDFEKFMGSYCCVKLYAPKGGSKEHLGYLREYNDGAVTISEGGKDVTFGKSEVASVQLRIEI
jgi:ribosome maturation factor RimP